jgi:hypothetical protein
MNYQNIFGHYYPHELRGEIYDGRNMKREKVTLKNGREVVRLTAPLKLYDKKVTRATWLRNLQKHIDRAEIEKRIEDIYFKADGIQELICEGGAEGAYSPKELSSMQSKVYALEAQAKTLEKRNDNANA